MEGFQLDAGIISPEPPVDQFRRRSPGGDLASQHVPVLYPPVEALPRQNIYPCLRYVQPTAVSRGVVHLDLPGEAKASYSVESLRVFKLSITTRSSFRGSGHRRYPGQAGKVLSGAAFGDPGMVPTERRGMGHEQVGGSVAPVFTVKPCRPPRHRYVALFCQLPRGGVHARQHRVVAIFPPVNTGTSSMARTKFAFCQGGRHQRFSFQGLYRFFMVFLTASLEMLSTISSSTSRSPSSCRVHCACPSGGREQASVTSRASPVPSRTRFFRFSCSFRSVPPPGRPRRTAAGHAPPSLFPRRRHRLPRRRAGPHSPIKGYGRACGALWAASITIPRSISRSLSSSLTRYIFLSLPVCFVFPLPNIPGSGMASDAGIPPAAEPGPIRKMCLCLSLGPVYGNPAGKETLRPVSKVL